MIRLSSAEPQAAAGHDIQLLEPDPGARRSRLVTAIRPFAAFALGALVVFGSVGIALFVAIQGQVRHYEEASAQYHAEFLANAVLRYDLQPSDLVEPPGDARQAALTTFVRERVLLDPAVRVKIWRPDGTILFSDDAHLAARRFANPEVTEASEGRTISEVEDLTKPENQYERALAPKLFSTYVPITLDPSGGRPQAVVEVYQRYSRIQSGIDSLNLVLVGTLGIALGVLYLLLFPIVLTTLALHADRARADRRTEEKSRFLAFMSHELRTPLNAMLGFAELLERRSFGDLNERQARYVGNIRSGGRQLLEVVNELLDFSRAEAGQLVVAQDAVVLRDVVEPVVEQLRPAAEAAGHLLLDELPKTWRVVGDSLRLQQVLTNLVNNAIKFTPSPGRVTIQGRLDDGWVEVSVSDDGAGIPAAELGRIFEPFSRVEGGPSARREGSGLGLSLARKLVEAMGGKLSVASALGAGSTFTIRLRQA